MKKGRREMKMKGKMGNKRKVRRKRLEKGQFFHLYSTFMFNSRVEIVEMEIIYHDVKKDNIRLKP